MTNDNHKLDEFMLGHGGPFYEMQQKLGLLQENAFRPVSRAMLFVAIAWLVPLILSVIEGNAVGEFSDKPFLSDFGVWARFFIAIGLFILIERQVQDRLREILLELVRAPILAPASYEAAAKAVTRARDRRDSNLAEVLILIIAVLATVASYFRMGSGEISSWAVQASSLTLTGWWCLLVSNPIFWFLLVRWFWRLCVWAKLLYELAKLQYLLVATHPDGKGGLSFLGNYPNAFTEFIFALSCVLGAALAQGLLTGEIAIEIFGYVMGIWLLLVLALLAWPLLAFRKPLTDLKRQSLYVYGAQATRHNMKSELKLLGENISASEAAESEEDSDIPDPTKPYALVKKQSVSLFNRSSLLPVSAAALLPLFAAGSTQMPYKELLKIAKRLLLL